MSEIGENRNVDGNQNYQTWGFSFCMSEKLIYENELLSLPYTQTDEIFGNILWRNVLSLASNKFIETVTIALKSIHSIKNNVPMICFIGKDFRRTEYSFWFFGTTSNQSWYSSTDIFGHGNQRVFETISTRVYNSQNIIHWYDFS